jgi:hypothetical protein
MLAIGALVKRLAASLHMDKEEEAVVGCARNGLLMVVYHTERADISAQRCVCGKFVASLLQMKSYSPPHASLLSRKHPKTSTNMIHHFSTS